MTVDPQATNPRDILASPWLAGAVYCLPSAAIVASGALAMASPLRGVLWAACLAVMAAGCLANALRCGRTHCYFTGPFLIVMALTSLAYGFGVLALGPGGWNEVSAATLGGAILFTFVPELVLGRYRRGR
jgi:apolipoprotein N-acyltransferase